MIEVAAEDTTKAETDINTSRTKLSRVVDMTETGEALTKDVTAGQQTKGKTSAETEDKANADKKSQVVDTTETNEALI